MEGETESTPPPMKIRELDEGGGEGSSTSANQYRCTLHPEVLTFNTYDQYDLHYNQEHLNRCQECRKNFPSSFILDLHIEECHDSLVAVRREKGEHTYSCFVEGCDRKCRDPQKRRRHLIDKHLYPQDFFFEVTKHGIDGRRSLLTGGGSRGGRGGRPRPGGTKPPQHDVESSKTAAADAAGGERGGVRSGGVMSSPPQQSGESSSPAAPQRRSRHDNDNTPRDVDMGMDGLAETMSSLKLMPRSVRFGRGGGKGGFARSH